MENDLKSLAAELRECAASLRGDGSWCLGYCDSMDAAADALDALSVPSEAMVDRAVAAYAKAINFKVTDLGEMDRPAIKAALQAALAADNTDGDLAR